MQARSLNECLRAESGVARLAGHAARLLRLQRVFESAVPRPLARGARVANLRLGKLVLHADNSAIAAKLRQLTPTLTDVFRNEVAEVTGIQVAVQARQDGRPRFPDVAREQLGEHAKQGLTSLAERLPETSPLRQALHQLVKHS